MGRDFREKNALIFVLITVAINSIGFGIMIPVLPTLVRELTGVANNEAALHLMGMTFIFALMQFVCMPIAGALSDAYGRRPVMLGSIAGLSLDYFLMALAPTIAVLYVGRAISGAFGATFSTANAYISDVSPPERRAQDFGLVGAVFGVGFMLGPVIGGWLGEFGPRVPFLAAGIICALNFVYGVIFLPETNKPENRRPFRWARANAVGAVKSLGRIGGVKGLIFVLFLLAIAHTAYPTTYTLTVEEQLGWSPGEVGTSLGAFGLASMIVQGGLIRVIIPKTGLFMAGLIGMGSAVIAYFTLGNATAGWIVYAAGPFAALAGLYGPALTNMMSTRVDASEQGELQGAIGAAQGLALMIGPLLMGLSFYVFGNAETSPIYKPGAPFILAALLAALALTAFFLVTNNSDRRAKSVEPGTTPEPLAD